MNKLVSLILVFLVLPTYGGVMAQTDQASPSAKTTQIPQTLEKDVQNLKDKIATKVAELRKKNLKAMAGVVLDNGDNNFRIRTLTETEYKINVDKDLTNTYQILTNQKKDIKLSDVVKGDYILVTGLVIDKTINANFIYKDEQYLVGTAKVTEVNKDDNYIKVLTSEKDVMIFDVDDSTKLQIIDSKTLDVEAAKFSKLKEGDTVHFVFKKTGREKEVNRFNAEKILIIPQEYFIK